MPPGIVHLALKDTVSMVAPGIFAGILPVDVSTKPSAPISNIDWWS